jgi:hypothetical protein
MLQSLPMPRARVLVGVRMPRAHAACCNAECCPDHKWFFLAQTANPPAKLKQRRLARWVWALIVYVLFLFSFLYLQFKFPVLIFSARGLLI